MTARILIRNKENNAVWAMDVAERFRKSVDARDVIEVALGDGRHDHLRRQEGR